MRKILQQSFQVSYQYPVFFTEGLFERHNTCFGDFISGFSEAGFARKILLVIDEGMAKHHAGLEQAIIRYCSGLKDIAAPPRVIKLPGGEVVKNEEKYFYQVVDAIHHYGIDRHSFVVAIGGGAVLDLAGYAAAVTHRGIKHIRVPTTVLSQNDSGVGVKNGINYAGKKNFLGSFAPPAAVFNDFEFLTTLDERDWRAGIAEAVKVALIKDADFFHWLEGKAEALGKRDKDSMQELIYRCAALHLQHIAGGDPFEAGSSRPLDFGHWSAHKLEQLSDFNIRHGEAVAIGIALDTVYSHLVGWLPEYDMERVLHLEKKIGFSLYHPLLAVGDSRNNIFEGLNEFREHLGGRLTIMLLESIGKGVETHEMDEQLMGKAIQMLEAIDKKN